MVKCLWYRSLITKSLAKLSWSSHSEWNLKSSVAFSLFSNQTFAFCGFCFVVVVFLVGLFTSVQRICWAVVIRICTPVFRVCYSQRQMKMLSFDIWVFMIVKAAYFIQHREQTFCWDELKIRLVTGFCKIKAMVVFKSNAAVLCDFSSVKVRIMLLDWESLIDVFQRGSDTANLNSIESYFWLSTGRQAEIIKLPE